MFSNKSTPTAAGTLVLDNVDFVNTPVALTYANNTDVILTGNRKIKSFVQGTTYSVFDALQDINNQTCFEPEASFARVQTEADPPPKPVSLLDSDGKFYERSKPQYNDLPVSTFKSIMTYGCSNDGVTDVTACVQNFFNSITTDEIAFIDQGAYVISDTITIPNNIKMIGELRAEKHELKKANGVLKAELGFEQKSSSATRRESAGSSVNGNASE